MRLRLTELIFVLLMTSCSYGFELPGDIGGWHCLSEYVVPLVLDVDSRDMGSITYRDYGRFQIIVTQGAGTGSLYVPEHVGDAKGVMPSESGYEVKEVAGVMAVLERHEYMPVALSVSVSEDTVITIESSALNDEDIADLASSILLGLR